VPPLASHTGPAIDPSGQTRLGTPGAGPQSARVHVPGQAVPAHVQAPLGSFVHPATVTVPSAHTVGGGGVHVVSLHDRISHPHVLDPDAFTHRPVKPPVEPSAQIVDATPGSGPQSDVAQSVRPSPFLPSDTLPELLHPTPAIEASAETETTANVMERIRAMETSAAPRARFARRDVS
jgi:hypothetical protein